MSRHSQKTFPATNESTPNQLSEQSGYGGTYVPRAVRPGTHIRQPEPITVKDIEDKPLKFIALALSALQRQFRRVATSIEDRSMAVDEYQSQTPTPPVTNTLTIQPQAASNRRVNSILGIRPAGACNGTLSDRGMS